MGARIYTDYYNTVGFARDSDEVEATIVIPTIDYFHEENTDAKDAADEFFEPETETGGDDESNDTSYIDVMGTSLNVGFIT